MHNAALNGHTAAVSLLLEQKADIEAKDKVYNLTQHDVSHSVIWPSFWPPSYPNGCCALIVPKAAEERFLSLSCFIAVVGWMDHIALGRREWSYDHHLALIGAGGGYRG